MLRFYVITALFLCLSFAACAPRDLSGTYLSQGSDPQGAIYYSLTSSSQNQLVGNLTFTHVEAAERSGVKSGSIQVSGTVNGSHIVFYSDGRETTAQLTGDGFSIDTTNADGTISSTEFHRTSVASLNSLVGNITQQGRVAREAYLQTATATIELTNLSSGNTEFYVDGQPSCSAPADTHCELAVHVTSPHTLFAITSYGNAAYRTPSTPLLAQPNARYNFEACGETGTYGNSCGLFTLSTP